MIEESWLENSKIQMRRGTLEFCILLIISKRKVYASDILNELKKSNLIVVEGTLYPLLSRLKSAGLLNYTWAESKAGPPRKYYTLTQKGKNMCDQLVKAWDELTVSIEDLRDDKSLAEEEQKAMKRKKLTKERRTLSGFEKARRTKK